MWGRPRADPAFPLWAPCHCPRPHLCQRPQVSFQCMQPAGAGEIFAFTEVFGQSCLFHFFDGILQCHPGHWSLTPLTLTHPVGQKNLWLTRHQSSLWAKSTLVLIFILVLNLTSLELHWSCRSVIGSEIRHQSILYFPDWGELSYQCEHLNVNEAREMEFCSQRLQWNAFTSV